MHVIRPASQKRTRDRVKAGSYVSTVDRISYDEDYVDKQAFRIEYTLVNQDGDSISYSEIFHYNDRNERTAQFFDYLEENGIDFNEDDLPDLVGLREHVTLKKSANFSRPIIVERNVISLEQESSNG